MIRAALPVLLLALAARAAPLVPPAELKKAPAVHMGKLIGVSDACRALSKDLQLKDPNGRTSAGFFLVNAAMPVLVEDGAGVQLAAIRAGDGCRVKVSGEVRNVSTDPDDWMPGRLRELGAKGFGHYLVASAVEIYASRCPPGKAEVFNPAPSYKRVYHPGQLAAGEPGEFEFNFDSDVSGLDLLEPWKASVQRGAKKVQEAALCVRIVPGAGRPPLQLGVLDTPRNRATLEALKQGGRMLLRGRSYGTSELDPALFFAAAELVAELEVKQP